MGRARQHTTPHTVLVFFSHLIFKPTKQACQSMRKKPQYVLYSSLADFIFLILYGFVTAPLVQKILHNMAGFVQCITNAKKDQSPLSFLFLIIVYILAVYLLFIIFQGLAWWTSTRIAGTSSGNNRIPKKKLKTYLLQFAKVNIAWYVFFVIVHVTSYFLTLTALVAKQAPDLAQPLAAKIAFALILYFAFLSHALLSHNKPGKAGTKAVSLGLKKYHAILPIYTWIGVVFFLVNACMVLLSSVLPRQTFSINILYYVIVALLVFPFFCWARTYLLMATTNYLNQKKH
jgi:hypothetical protein